MHQIHGFDLECLHEALGLGVVVGIAAPAHGAGETVLLQDGAIVFGGILGRFKWSSQRFMRSYDDQMEAAIGSFW